MGLLSVGLRWIRGHTDLWHVRRGVIMWKLGLILVLAAVIGQGTARNLHRLARQANDLARNPDCPACDCRTHQRKTHVVVHWPHRHTEPPCACCECGDRFVHMHMKKKDIFHGNAVPGAEMWAKGKKTFATCKIIPGSREELSGTIYMKQDLMGKGPVSAHFDISGFDESADHTAHHGHEHHFQISWYTYGDAANACATQEGSSTCHHLVAMVDIRGTADTADVVDRVDVAEDMQMILIIIIIIMTAMVEDMQTRQTRQTSCHSA